jgi:hypothetical protein
MANAGNIRAWLAELGLAKYAEAFASNDIDLDILPELTDADLERLGVASLGDRKRLLKAIASIASAEKSSVVPTTTGPSPTDAERRQVTVMFSDLVWGVTVKSYFSRRPLPSFLQRPEGSSQGHADRAIARRPCIRSIR